MPHEDAVHIPYYLIMHAVIAVGGTSETALRAPSLIAMCVAVGLTAAIGRRLAEASCLPAPSVLGLAAGLLLIAVPQTTRYAQEARPYALATLFAVLSTYLLLRAVEATADGAAARRWLRWLPYSLALTLTGLFNLFALLLAAGHGLSLLAARGRRGTRHPRHDSYQAAGGTIADGTGIGWLSACALAAVLLVPMTLLSASQSVQLNWLAKPSLCTVASSARDFAGGALLIPVAAVLAVLGCVAGLGLRSGHGLSVALVALPWLLLPPAVLVAASATHPVYLERYVLFCLPALSLLLAAGLAGLFLLTRQSLARLGLRGRRGALLAVIPSLALGVAIAAAVTGPQRNARLAGAKVDNLREVAMVLSRHERPGDAVLYMPWSTAVAGMAYPAPFRRLRDIELGAAPVASATLTGLPAPLGVVAGRLISVTRVWTVEWAPRHPSCGPQAPKANPTPLEVVAARSVSRMRLIQRWSVASLILTLYVAG